MTDNKIYTLDDLLQHLVTSFQAQNDHHFYDGDLINAWCHASDLKEVPLGKIAEHLQCSKAYVGNLWKCSKFYPQEVREAFTDHKWTWFVELLSMPEAKSGEMSAMDICTKYAEMSLRELKDLKLSLGGKKGNVRLTVTLNETQIGNIMRDSEEDIKSNFPDGTTIEVSVRRDYRRES